jgi:CubicO group peptidase (beta-lactamase class C family)
MKRLERAGFSVDTAEKLEAGIRSGLLPGVHAVLVNRGGETVLEHYGAGPDEDWGRPLGHVAFNADTLHDLRSVTKSVVGLLYGIALDRKLVPPAEASLLAQFPEYHDLAADPQRAKLTIAHALTMSLGTEWNEDLPYTDPANSEIMMENAADRFRFILDRPVNAPPGTRWTYSGGCTALIGRLIERGSSKSLADFAREALFVPLGITEFDWSRGRDGVHSAASGLRLRPCDLMQIGELLLGAGTWRGRQIVSQAWLSESFEPAIETGDGLGYGRFWYLGEALVLGKPQRWIGAFGNGGQRLWIMPSAKLCAVILAGNYNSPGAWVYPTRIWREILLASVIKP